MPILSQERQIKYHLRSKALMAAVPLKYGLQRGIIGYCGEENVDFGSCGLTENIFERAPSKYHQVISLMKCAMRRLLIEHQYSKP